MNWPVPISQTLIAFALHVAIITAILAALGSMAAFAMRRISATIRRELMVGLLLAIVAVPALAGVYHFRLLTPATPETSKQSAMPISNPVASSGSSVMLDLEFAEPNGLVTDGAPRILPIRWLELIGGSLVSLWVLGVVIQLVRGCRAALRRRALWRSLLPTAQDTALMSLDRLRQEMGIRRSVRLATSPLAPCPFTTGILRPLIVIPARLIETASAQKLEAALIHELVHVKRFDLIPHALGELAIAVHWWCPSVRRVTAELSRAGEEICDDQVLAMQRDGQPLAELLVECAQSAAGLHAATAICMSTGSTNELKQRVNLLLKENVPMIRISSMFASFIVTAVLTLAALLVHADYAYAQKASAARFIPLGDLPGGDFFSRTLGISADGSVVLGSSHSAQGDEAFRWTEADGLIPLGDIPGGNFQSRARQISTDGKTIIGFGRSAGGQRAIMWQDGVLTELGNIPEQDSFSDARSVSDDGTKITVVGHEQSYVWTEGDGFSPLGAIHYPVISGDGNVFAGHADIEGTSRPAFYDRAGSMPLGELPDGGGKGHVWSLSNDGSVVVGWAESRDGRWQAFRYENGIMEGLGFIGEEKETIARDVTADGSVVVGKANWRGTDHDPEDALGFIWDSKNGMRSVQEVFEVDFLMDLNGYRILDASSISANGQFIGGIALNPSGAFEGYVADLGVPVPEPSCGIMATCGAMIAGAFLLRNRRKSSR